MRSSFRQLALAHAGLASHEDEGGLMSVAVSAFFSADIALHPVERSLPNFVAEFVFFVGWAVSGHDAAAANVVLVHYNKATRRCDGTEQVEGDRSLRAQGHFRNVVLCDEFLIREGFEWTPR